MRKYGCIIKKYKNVIACVTDVRCPFCPYAKKNRLDKKCQDGFGCQTKIQINYISAASITSCISRT